MAEQLMTSGRSGGGASSAQRRKERPERALSINDMAPKTGIVIAAILVGGSVSLAAEDFPINGTYRQGRPCNGDEASLRAELVTITPQKIAHPGGVCTIDDKRQNGNTVVMRTTCRDQSGTVLSGDVSFTIRDSRTLDMSAQDGLYKAVLNRCPEPSKRSQPKP